MQAQVADQERKFPLRFRRPFQLWSYQASHRHLVLRESPAGGASGAAEIEFLNVLGMKLKSQYSELLICTAPDTTVIDIDEFVAISARHRSKFTTLLVSDGSDDGFVVCGSLRVHEG